MTEKRTHSSADSLDDLGIASEESLADFIYETQNYTDCVEKAGQLWPILSRDDAQPTGLREAAKRVVEASGEPGLEEAIRDMDAILMRQDAISHNGLSAATGYDEPQGYAASLRQQADWVEKARAGEMDSNDIDVDELRAAADFIERLTAVPQAEPMTDSDLRRLWREAGGDFHGPKVEHGSMPETKLLPFLRSLALSRPQSECGK